MKNEREEYQSYAKKVYEVLDAKRFWNNTLPSDTKRFVDEFYDTNLDSIFRFSFITIKII